LWLIAVGIACMQVHGEYNCLFQPCLIDAFDEQLLICAISYMKCLLIICFFHAMLASTGISCRHVSVCLSVTSQCSIETEDHANNGIP